MKQGTQTQCTGTTQRDGMGRKVGGGVRDGEHMYIRGWFMPMYGKNHHNIVVVLPYIDMNPSWVYMCSPSWTPLPPSSPSHPSGSSQGTSPENTVSCIEPVLVIHFTYDNIHGSMPFSQINPRSPSPTESKRLFYTSVSFCRLACGVIVTTFLNSIYMRYYTVLLFLFLTYFTLYNRLQFHSPH